jgi:hypothetical protein
MLEIGHAGDSAAHFGDESPQEVAVSIVARILVPSVPLGDRIVRVDSVPHSDECRVIPFNERPDSQ